MEVLRKPVVSFATVATAKIIVIISAIIIFFVFRHNNFSKHLLSKTNHLISKNFLYAPTRQVKTPRRSNCGWSHQVQSTKVESTTSAYFVRWLHAFFHICCSVFFICICCLFFYICRGALKLENSPKIEDVPKIKGLHFCTVTKTKNFFFVFSFHLDDHDEISMLMIIFIECR